MTSTRRDDEALPPARRWLAEVAAALDEAGHFGTVVDRDWRIVFETEASAAAGGFLVDAPSEHAGAFLFGRASMERFAALPVGSIAMDFARAHLEHLGGWVVQDLGGGRDRLRSLVDPRLADTVDRITEPGTAAAITFAYDGFGVGGIRPRMAVTALRVHGPEGEVVGTALVQKPALSMMVLAVLGAMRDPQHLDRMQRVAAAGRRPGAILFADLVGSAALAKRLSTPSYFSLGRRLTRIADACVVDAGGITGRHGGDGVVAFFLAEHLGSEAEAAGACIRAARAVRAAMPEVAGRSGLAPDELTMRFGLHWGSNLYVGLISTVGRTEVTALGDDVNDAARIEPCAARGQILASKQLVERLTPALADELAVDLDGGAYTQLGDLTTATEKARRDAPSIAVCEL